MATTPTHSSENSPFTLSFNAQTDFTVLADHCERFADALIESRHSDERRALCYHLADCLTLAKLLCKHTFNTDEEKQLTGLLFELVCYFADELRAPRWIRTVDGVKFIDEVVV
ncbi:hypothetical protein XK97_08685 [Obesumbacterium proteus]|uniref:hypothetical protein n=1 Tax=Obesumbacterium proteus TaxID=82983 RepID=UPI000621E98D|nr:hypothetical protein [Obesumbacterium proteus]KKI47665.1 hypothetical protein XK97_08685 [Obesumbacterium proteus]